MNLLPLVPSVKNSLFWAPTRPKESVWDKTRAAVLERDQHACRFCSHKASKYMQIHHVGRGDDNTVDNLVTACVACHAVHHVGRNLSLGTIEVWQCEVPQTEIVTLTRKGIASGLTLAQVRETLPLSPGPHPAGSLDYANELLALRSKEYTLQLSCELRVIFVALKQWQLN